MQMDFTTTNFFNTKKTKKTYNFKYFFRAIKPYKIPLIVSTLLIHMIGISFPLIILISYSKVIPSENTNSLIVLTLFAVFLFVLDYILKICRGLLIFDIEKSLLKQFKTRQFWSMLNTKFQLRPNNPWPISLDHKSSVQPQSGSLDSLIDLPFLTLYCILLISISPILILPLLAVVVFFVFSFSPMNLLYLLSERHRTSLEKRKFHFLSEILLSMQSIKTLNSQPSCLRRFEKLHKNHIKTEESFYQAIYLINKSQQILSHLGLFLTLFIACTLSLFQIISLGELAGVIFITFRLFSPIPKIGHAILSYTDYLGQWRHLNFSKKISNSKPIEGFDIVLRNVEIYSSSKNTAILKNTHLTLPFGKIIWLSNFPKQDLNQLSQFLLGDTPLKQGEYLFTQPNQPNIKISPFPLKKMAYLDGQNTLFEGSLLDNLRGFDPNISLQEIKSWMSTLGFDHQIEALEDGYHTKYFDSAPTNLSRGILTQIAISRTLFLKPKFIFFNHANEGLDRFCDQQLLKYLKSLKCHATILLVSDRPSYIRLADYQLRYSNKKLLLTKLEESHFEE